MLNVEDESASLMVITQATAVPSSSSSSMSCLSNILVQQSLVQVMVHQGTQRCRIRRPNKWMKHPRERNLYMYPLPCQKAFVNDVGLLLYSPRLCVALFQKPKTESHKEVVELAAMLLGPNVTIWRHDSFPGKYLDLFELYQRNTPLSEIDCSCWASGVFCHSVRMRFEKGR